MQLLMSRILVAYLVLATVRLIALPMPLMAQPGPQSAQQAQQTPAVKANYQLAARFSSKKLEKMIFSTTVDPHWLKKSNRFWYTYETTEGKKWYIVAEVIPLWMAL